MSTSQSELWAIIITILSIVLPPIITIAITIVWNHIDTFYFKKSERDILLIRLRKNAGISKTLDIVRRLDEYAKNNSAFFLVIPTFVVFAISLALVFIIFLIIYACRYFLTLNDSAFLLLFGFSFIASNLTSLFAFYFFLKKQVKISDFGMNYFNQYKKTRRLNSFLNEFVSYFNFYLFYLMYLAVKIMYDDYEGKKTGMLNFILNHESLWYFIVMFLFWITGCIIGLFLLVFYKKYCNTLKFNYEQHIQNMYKKLYPNVFTNQPHIKGKIDDIFDRDFLVLNSSGKRIFVRWESIDTLQMDNE